MKVMPSAQKLCVLVLLSEAAEGSPTIRSDFLGSRVTFVSCEIAAEASQQGCLLEHERELRSSSFVC